MLKMWETNVIVLTYLQEEGDDEDQVDPSFIKHILMIEKICNCWYQLLQVMLT